MFSLAFVSGWLEGHWWGFISRNYVVWPTFFLMNVFIALKGSHFWFYIGVSTSEAYLPSFSSVVKRKLISRFKANLTKTLNKSSDTNQGKLRTYAYFKTIFQKEKYLSVINNVDIRECFMYFRISAHKLEIEVGRYKNIPALNRICKVCSSGEVEDERHLIFSCNKYSSLRQSFFTETQKICKNFSTLTQDAQFFWLMNNESEDVFILFSNYIYECFKLRDV